MLSSALNFAELKLTCASFPTQVDCATTVGQMGCGLPVGTAIQLK